MAAIRQPVLRPGEYARRLRILSGVELPKGVPFAERSKVGFSCATCDFLSKDRKHCSNETYQEEEGTDELGAKAEEFCCVVWTPEGGR